MTFRAVVGRMQMSRQGLIDKMRPRFHNLLEYQVALLVGVAICPCRDGSCFAGSAFVFRAVPQ